LIPTNLGCLPVLRLPDSAEARLDHLSGLLLVPPNQPPMQDTRVHNLRARLGDVQPMTTLP
jgi:hypothetical protein